MRNKQPKDALRALALLLVFNWLTNSSLTITGAQRLGNQHFKRQATLNVKAKVAQTIVEPKTSITTATTTAIPSVGDDGEGNITSGSVAPTTTILPARANLAAASSLSLPLHLEPSARIQADGVEAYVLPEWAVEPPSWALSAGFWERITLAFRGPISSAELQKKPREPSMMKASHQQLSLNYRPQAIEIQEQNPIVRMEKVEPSNQQLEQRQLLQQQQLEQFALEDTREMDKYDSLQQQQQRLQKRKLLPKRRFSIGGTNDNRQQRQPTLLGGDGELECGESCQLNPIVTNNYLHSNSFGNSHNASEVFQ